MKSAILNTANDFSADMSRDDVYFQVAYSMHLEDYMRTLQGRLDRASRLLILLSLFVLATTDLTACAGLLLVLLSSYQLLCRPGQNSAVADASFKRWSRLYREMSSLTTGQLLERFHAAACGDSTAIVHLVPLAHRAAAVQLNLDLGACPVLTLTQRLSGRLAGALSH